MEDRTGDLLHGYKLQERIGYGGFGEVYRAQQTTTGIEREVALKIILPQYANNPDFIRRFEVEAQVIARLEHMHIVPLHDYWRDAEGAYLVMRWFRGGSLKMALSEGAYNLEDTAMTLSQIGAALSFAHRNNIIHRDLKPGNILLDEDGNACLADFGIAKDISHRDGNITDPDDIVGSPGYLAPEQARSEPVTPQTDIYSLGVVLYEMLTGEHPFPDLQPVEQLFKHLNEPLPDIQTLPGDVQVEVNRIIKRATAKKPGDRYQTVLEMVQAFREVVATVETIADENVLTQLTDREMDIVRLIVAEMSNQEIANKLVVTKETVRWYIRQINRKLNVSNRQRLIEKLTALGVGSDTPHISIESDPSTIMGLVELPPPPNPYKGLQAFQTADAQDYFGREKLISKVIQRLDEKADFSRFLAIVGPSGSGKSSLVKAGIIPALWRGEIAGADRWFIADMLPGQHPLDELEVALMRVTPDRTLDLNAQLTRDERGLVRLAQMILPDDSSDLLIIVDQFEEVFTLVEGEAERVQFLKLLHAAVTEKRSRVRVVVTLRADFYDRPLHYTQFGELVRNRMVTVLPLSAEELEHAITKPAQRVGVKFEEGLVATIADEVSYQPGALPLLQYALTELFEQREGRTLTHAAYQEIGGTVGALAKRAEELFNELTEEAQETTRQMFLRLVTLGEGVEDTRRRTPQSELAAITDNEDLLTDIIDVFVEYRLLSLDNDPATRTPTVEVAHEAILREWERLRNWLNESRNDVRMQRQLAQMATEWRESNQDKSFLLRGSRLKNFEGWITETGLAVTPQEREYLSTSTTEYEREVESEKQRELERQKFENRARQVLQGLVGVFLIAAIVAGGLAIFAFDQQATAKGERDNAQRERDLANRRADENQSLVLNNAAQDAVRNGDSLLALALAVEANQIENPPLESQEFLLSLAKTVHVQRSFSGHEGIVNDIVLTPNGRMALSASNDNTLILWDIDTGEMIRQFEGHVDAVRTLALSNNGQVALSGGSDNTLILWDVMSGEEIGRLAGHDVKLPPGTLRSSQLAIRDVAFAPSGDVVASTGGDDTVILWDVATQVAIKKFAFDDFAPQSIVFSPDGGAILAVDRSKKILLRFDITSGALVYRIEGTGGNSREIDISPNGQSVLSAWSNGLVLYDAQTGAVIHNLLGRDGAVTAVAFSPDGKMAVSGGDDGALILWDIENGTEILRLGNNPVKITSIAYSPDNRHIISSAADGTLLLWDNIERSNIAETMRFGELGSQITDVDVSPDGNTIVSTARRDGGITIDVWAVETGELLHRLDGLIFVRRGIADRSPIAFSPDGLSILAGGGRGSLILWDVESGAEIGSYTIENPFENTNPSQITAIQFSHNDTTVLVGLAIPRGGGGGGRSRSGKDNGTVILLDLETGLPHHRLDFNEDTVESVVFSPDDSTIAIGLGDGTLIIWDIQNWMEIQRLDAGRGSFSGIAFTPDGERLLSATLGETVRLWDVQTGTILREFKGDLGTVQDIAVSPDGRTCVFVTGTQSLSSDANSIHVWDIEIGAEINYIDEAHTKSIYSVVFTPDGEQIITGSFDGTIRGWNVVKKPLLKWIEENRYVRELTPEERAQFGLPPR